MKWLCSLSLSSFNFGCWEFKYECRRIWDLYKYLSLFHDACWYKYRTESELVEEIATDVLQKLNLVYVGDLDQEIAKLERLEQLQHDHYKSVYSWENRKRYEATAQRVKELKLERSIRLLRLTPEMLSYMEDSD